ncbi:TSUP family transporter [Actinomyces culturomici]|uniref:TSUP family transporter n=1 Tax=Actinomyces culturomici TaxID=1926276 RepID=UPI000E20C73D|nr:TSUP family transporter [Actinomyces culturomici]
MLALVVAAVLFGAILQRASGIGFAVVVAPFALIAGGATHGVILTQLLGATSAALTLLSVHRDVEWREYGRLLPSSLLGLVLATALAARLPDAPAQIVSSAIMLVLLLLAPRIGAAASVYRNWSSLSIAGAAAGAMTVLAGVGAAALTALQQATNWEQSRFVATLQPYLITVSTLTVGARLAVAPTGWPDFSLGAWVLIGVALILGIRAGDLVSRRLLASTAKRITFIVALVGAGIALVDGFASL